MVYRILRIITKIALKIFFKKIYFSNTERIPKGKPMILAANHPTAFIEPCTLACFLDFPLHFLVRGDLFIKPLYIKMMNTLHMVPIYRRSDGGYNKLKNNYETFEFCYKALSERKAIMILVEGNTIHEKRLRPIRKGAARIAFGAAEKYPELDIHIVPVGVNYTYADQFRKETMIDFGEPIRIKNLIDDYNENQKKTIFDLTKEIGVRLKKQIISIDKKKDEELVEKLFVLFRSDHEESILPISSSNEFRVRSEQKIANLVNNLSEEDKEKLKEPVNAYFTKLYSVNVNDSSVVTNQIPAVFTAFVLLTGLVPFIIGYILNILPIALGKYIANTRVKNIEFYTPVALAIDMGGYFIYWILFLVLAIIFGGWPFILLVMVMPFLGYFAIVYREFFKKKMNAWRFYNLGKKTNNILIKERAAVLEVIQSVDNSVN